MTVADLIEKLAEFPPDMPIFWYDAENMELHDALWVGIMADETKEDGAGVVIHNYEPSTKAEGDWITRA